MGALFGVEVPDEPVAKALRALDEEVSSLYLFPDSCSTIARLRNAGMRVGICSNLAYPYEQAVKGLLPIVDAYTWSYEAGAVTPDPAIYQHVIKQLDCSSSDVLFVGDTPAADVEGPRVFGMSARLIDRKGGQSLEMVLADLL